MPKEVFYGPEELIEVQWATDGQLVCVVVGDNYEETVDDRKGGYVNRSMHQFTSADSLNRFISVLNRAKRKAFTYSE